MQLKKLLVTLAAATLLAGTANALPYSEARDAGQTIATAQVTAGSGALTSIAGELPLFRDADMYRIHVDGGLFSANTYGTEVHDVMLHLYSLFGFRLLFNDDSYIPNVGPTLQSKISSVLPAGDYYLAISEYGVGYSYNNASSWPKAYYDGSGEYTRDTDYIINLTGASFATAVPEPSTLLLLGAGLAGLALARRRAKG